MVFNICEFAISAWVGGWGLWNFSQRWPPHLPLCSWGLLCCSRDRGLAGWVCLWNMCSAFIQVELLLRMVFVGVVLPGWCGLPYFAHVHNFLTYFVCWRMIFLQGKYHHCQRGRQVERLKNSYMMRSGTSCVHYPNMKRCGACTKGWFDLGGPAWRELTGGELPGHIRGVKSK